MPIQRATAKKLVSESEFKLINESFPPLVGALSDKALVQRMERARKARDRYHTMVERQRSKASSGTKRSAAPSANMKDVVSKEKIFEETLARFERRTAKAGGSAAPKAAMPAKSAAKSASKPAAKGAAPAKSATGRAAKQASPDKAKATAAKSSGMKAGVNRPARSTMGKKTDAKGGAQGTSKASVKMANKATAGAKSAGAKTAAAKSSAAKTAGAKSAGAKATAKAIPKTGKGKGGATKNTPRGRHGAMVPSTTLH